MIKPKDIEITDIDGVVRKFVIARFPATAGMEILYRLPTSGIPKIGDFEALKGVRNDVFKHVYIKTDGGDIALSTTALIDNHCGDGETAIKLMGEILVYNYSFLERLVRQNLLDSILAKVRDTALSFLTEFSQQLSQKSKPASKN